MLEVNSSSATFQCIIIYCICVDIMSYYSTLDSIVGIYSLISALHVVSIKDILVSHQFPYNGQSGMIKSISRK